MLVDYSFYIDTYLGTGVSAGDFPRIALRAHEAIDTLTRGSLAYFPTMPENVQALVKKAVCAQIEYYGAYSTEVGFKAEDEGFTVGKVTVGGGSRDADANGNKMFYSPRAISFLERAGLLNRSVGVVC